MLVERIGDDSTTSAIIGTVLLGGTEARRLRKRAKKPRSARVAARVRDQPRNGHVYLTWPFAPGPMETLSSRDPFDRAHDIKSADGLLVPSAKKRARSAARAGVLPGSKPRRYPECLLNSRGVAFDTVADETYERQQRLERELGEVHGITASPCLGNVVAAACGRYAAQRGETALRRMCRVGRSLKVQGGE